MRNGQNKVKRRKQAKAVESCRSFLSERERGVWEERKLRGRKLRGEGESDRKFGNFLVVVLLDQRNDNVIMILR